MIVYFSVLSEIAPSVAITMKIVVYRLTRQRCCFTVI